MERQLMEALISEIQIYEDRQPDGQWLKSIKFKLPIIEEDIEMSLDNDKHVEKETDFDTYKDVFDVNYFGALRLVKSVTPYMETQKKGRVIFTSSGVGVTGFMNISAYNSTKGALEALAKCLRIEYAKDNITFHIMHPPLTRTKSASPLPVPDEFKALPENVGYGLARHIYSKKFIICHSLNQKIQTLGCYLFPTKMGDLLSKLTANCTETKN